jgi:ammonium transporter, Amt family
VNQAIGVLTTMGLSVVATLVILMIVKVTVGLRVTDEDEFVGLDVSQHGERAYND